MLPSPLAQIPQDSALPVDVENEDLIQLLENGKLYTGNVPEYILRTLDDMLKSPPLGLEAIDQNSVMHTSAAAGLQFANPQFPEAVEDVQTGNPTIPLCVQQERLDSIDPQTAIPGLGYDDDQSWVGFDVNELIISTATTTCQQFPASVHHQSVSPEPSDQTVPFRRHDSVSSALSGQSGYAEVKKERCSVTEAESTTPASPSMPPATCQADSQTCRRGRPCLNDQGSTQLCEKKEKRREQNRRAATKCRNKRRKEQEQLKQNLDKVVKDNEQLKATVRQLYIQNQQLENKLRVHQQFCGLTLPSDMSS